MPGVTATTQVDVLNAVKDRITDQLDQFTDNVFVTASAPTEPPEAITQNLFLTISPTSGRFDESEFIGGAQHTLIEDTQVLVVVWNAIRLDRTGEDLSLLVDDSRGLFVIKHKLLKALTGHPLRNRQGELIVTRPLQPMTSESPKSGQDEQRRQHLGDLGLVFKTQFHWDLT